MREHKRKRSKFVALFLALAMIVTAFTIPSGPGLIQAKAADGETVSVEKATSIEEGEQYIFLGYSSTGATNCAMSTDNGQYASQRLAINVTTNAAAMARPDDSITEITFGSAEESEKCLWTAEASGTENVWYFSNGGKYLQRNYAATYWDTSTSYKKEWLYEDGFIKGNGENYWLAKTNSNNYFNSANSSSNAAVIYHVIADDPTQPHYTVTFATNGGTAVDPQSVQEGKKVKKPTTSYEGHLFQGWYSDEAMTQEYDFSSAVTSAFTLYAKWAESVTVTFETNGGPAIDAQTIAKGSTIAQPADPVREDYTFKGWFADAGLENAYDFTQPVTADTIIYEKWEKQPVITIGDGTATSRDLPYGNYYKNSTAEMIYTADEMGADCTITSVSFNVSATASATGFATTSVKIYMGYKDTATFSGTSDCVPAEDLTLVYDGAPALGKTTGWEKLTLDTPFEYETSAGNLVVAVTHTSTSYSSSLNYRYTSKTGSALYRQNDSATSYGDITSTTNFSASANRPNIKMDAEPLAGTKYTVTFNTNGGSAIDPVQVREGKTVKQPEDPTKAGALLAGWYKDEALTQPWDFATDTISGDTTIYAKWNTSYTVKFETNGGSAVEDVVAAEGSKITEPETSKYGFKIAGWYRDEGLTQAWDFANDAVTANTTLYAGWEEIPAKLYEVELADGLEDGEEYFITGTAIKSTNGDQGYTLARSRTGSSAAGEQIRMVEKDGKLYIASETVGQEMENCKWEATDTGTGYRLSNTYNDSTLYISAASAYGTTLTMSSAVPTYYWSQTASSDSDLAAVQLKNSNTYASYSYYLNVASTTANLGTNAKVRLYKFTDSTLSDYTVSFETNGAGTLDAVTVKEGKRVKKPEGVTKEGWYLAGWYTDEALTQAWDFASDRVAGNMTLYAKWEPAYVAQVVPAEKLEAGETYIVLNNNNAYAMTSEKHSAYAKMNKVDVTMNAAGDKVTFQTEDAYKKCAWLAGEGTTEGYVTLFNDQSGATGTAAGYLWNYYAALYNYQYSTSSMSNEWKLSEDYGLIPNPTSASQYAVQFNTSATYMLFDAKISTSLGSDKVNVYQVKFDEEIAVPEAETDLVYNGQEQTGVAAGEGYTLTSASAKDAGDYTAVAILADGYVWADGTKEDKEISWSISQSELTAVYAGEEATCALTPELKVEVTGFVGDEDADTAAEYTAPAVTLPDDVAAGGSYELTPAGGSAKNYRFTYTGGTLTVADHVAGEAVTENEKNAGYETDASYEDVVYCEVCGAELSRETVTVEHTNHKELAESAAAVAADELEKAGKEKDDYDAYSQSLFAVSAAAEALDQAKDALDMANSELALAQIVQQAAAAEAEANPDDAEAQAALAEANTALTKAQDNVTAAEKVVADAETAYDQADVLLQKTEKEVNRLDMLDVLDPAIVALAKLNATVDAGKYTTDSYQVYADAFEAFKELANMDENELTASDVRAARSAVTKAYVSLVAKDIQVVNGKADKAAVGYATLAKAAKTFNLVKASGNSGKLSYSKAAGSSAYATVNTKTGAITLKKGTPAGVQTVNVKISAAATDTSLAAATTVTVKITVNKAAQTMKVSAKTKNVKASKVKAKKQTVSAITVKNAKGTKTYSKVSGSRKLTINAKTGKITVKKGTKKGTYKMKVKVTAKGNKNYKAATKNVNVTVKVR